MSKFEAEAKAFEFLTLARADIVAGNYFLAKSYLRDAVRMANKAGCKRMAGFAMLAMQRVSAAMGA